MPFNELQRRDSWPPTILRVYEDEDDSIDAIDENPFSYFLTPEDLDDDIEDLSAGIETIEQKPPVRTISPSSLQKDLGEAVDDEDDNVTFGVAIPLSLREFTMSLGTKNDEEKKMQEWGPEERESARSSGRKSRRGRPMMRIAPPRSSRGRGQTRSLSVRRPPSWRLPSPDIWAIAEERESEDGESNEAVSMDTGKENAAPKREASEEPPATPKPKKRVHWAL
ncbi:hypothetical protein BP5796_10244 [Coleophoma crateriformis]|uniref:Uncharacterized protein n=1 Tax=Coleophoma crateriformis TaxID=565419 RepID=A0A3D8QUV6_9HELO|nr:hypothetical protein BP5796_10244 [Coleophoma crateriformis]